ncbi:hypothetical protein IWQ62_000516 [Dispira parvispora]|uniref:Uncharacterized protein n=1 Tax=Dispira parvispora TaxID=1520584 RepID=A0A9W8E5Y7_9FUNG|nr:hypothetical protein IWQ62_000516 [Dispira parvispora]
MRAETSPHPTGTAPDGHPPYSGQSVAWATSSQYSLPSSFDSAYFSDSSIEEPGSPLSQSFIRNCEQYLVDSGDLPSLPPTQLTAVSTDASGNTVKTPTQKGKRPQFLMSNKSSVGKRRILRLRSRTPRNPTPSYTADPVSGVATSPSGVWDFLLRPLRQARKTNRDDTSNAARGSTISGETPSTANVPTAPCAPKPPRESTPLLQSMTHWFARPSTKIPV